MAALNKNAKILLIEDDWGTIQSVSFFLRREGYVVEVATSGEEALKVFTPDIQLILLDLVMPKMNGFEVLRILREQGIKIPIVVFSNLSGESEIQKALGLGADEYLIKSTLSTRAIIEKVEAVLRKSHG